MVKGARWDHPSPRPTPLPCHPQVGESLLPGLAGCLEPHAPQDPVTAVTIPEPCVEVTAPHTAQNLLFPQTSALLGLQVGGWALGGCLARNVPIMSTGSSCIPLSM